MIGSGRMSRVGLAVWTALIMLFLFVPIAIIIVYAFNKSNVQSWPPPGLSTKWFSSTFHNQEAKDAFWLSVRAALISTGISLLLGSMAAFAVHRFRFFGREAVSFLLVLPIALPGIITGMALNSFFSNRGLNFSLTLGDYITPQLVSSTQFIGNVVYANVGVAGNLPLAAAFATVPILIMIAYLALARRLGAFESL